MQRPFAMVRSYALLLGVAVASCVGMGWLLAESTAFSTLSIVLLSVGVGAFLALLMLWASRVARSMDPEKRDLEREVSILQKEVGEARDITRSFLQMGAQYSLICRPEGYLIEANADFYARCRLDPNASEDEKKKALQSLIPLDELAELAERSLAENVALTGIPATFAFPEGPRKVQVSLRAVEHRGRMAILMVVADKKREAELEQQIDQFSDSVELMVDQKVARITAGGITAESALTKAGVAIARFEEDGGLISMNPVAEQLTGRTSFSIRNITEFFDAFSLETHFHQSLTDWYGSGETGVLFLELPEGEAIRPALVVSAREQRPGQAPHRLLAWIPIMERITSNSDTFEQLRHAVAALSLHSVPAEAHSYVEVIQEAVSRIDRSMLYGGDGAFVTPTPHEPL